MVEDFKVIKDFENYSVSNLGNVRNDKTGLNLKQATNEKGYKFVGLSKNGKTTHKRIHRLIAEAFIPNPEKKSLIDHIDNNPCNNNIDNLRWSTHRENSQNAKKSTKNCSGFKGVSWIKAKNKWRAYLMIDGKLKHLGYFDNIEDAKKVRQEFANKFFGEYTNSCEKIININIANVNININQNNTLNDLDKEIENLLNN